MYDNDHFTGRHAIDFAAYLGRLTRSCITGVCRDRTVPETALIRESRFADVLVIDTATSFEEIADKFVSSLARPFYPALNVLLFFRKDVLMGLMRLCLFMTVQMPQCRLLSSLLIFSLRTIIKQ